MADVAVLTAGVPIWIDLGSSDMEASKQFYGQLFGWQFEPGPPETGGYGLFKLNGKQVAGLMPLMNPQQPVAWMSYVQSDDADATTEKVKAAGGNVLAEPMAVMELGRMAIFQDPAGAVIGIWEPKQMRGVELFNEPGSLIWNELGTGDPEAAKNFYPQVFGWEAKSNSNQGMEYVEWHLGGRSVAGMMPFGPDMPANMPPYWLVYFQVDDCQTTVEKAQQLGAHVMAGPMQIPMGTFAVLTDPQGAAFGVISTNR